ncbi:MAG: RecX family transcriptional regulator [Muribaculaceae bacterium]|nr:RecX family transcriptional regulator [Muribaculaceae bacterium]
MKQSSTPQQAYERMADRCARAEYCSGEVRERLRRQGLSAADALAITERLQRERFIDDGRYARAFVRQKSGYSRWGRRKIAAALAAKRVDRAIIAEAMTEISPEAYAEGLRALLAAKARSHGPDALATYDGRTRLFRFAASRGFETTAIAAALRVLIEAAEE